MSQPPLLEVRDATKRFGGVSAVQDISFDIFPGEIMGLIGPNGAGKTTLINLITGTAKPTHGTITFRGASIGGLKPYRIGRMGIARTFQVVRPFANLTVLFDDAGRYRVEWVLNSDGVFEAWAIVNGQGTRLDNHKLATKTPNPTIGIVRRGDEFLFATVGHLRPGIGATWLSLFRHQHARSRLGVPSGQPDRIRRRRLRNLRRRSNRS